MAINIAQTIANGAAGVVKALADPGGVAGTILAATIGATTAAQIATIVAQRNAIKNTSPGASGGGGSAPTTGSREITGYAEGGYTGAGGKYEPAGIVHHGEWVAPKWMVQSNPVVFSNLERYRRSGSGGRSGSVARGFADGGFTDPVNGKIAGNAMTKADIEAAVEAAIAKSMQNGAIRAYLVRNDLTELDAQTDRLKQQTSR